MENNLNREKQLAYQETMETTVPEEEFTPDALTTRTKIALATVTTDNELKERTIDSEKSESEGPILGKWSLGTTDSRYDIGGLLGKGGMGKVYLAHDANLDRDVAVKVLLEKHAAKSNRRDNFLREARVTASLEHPSILPVYDVDQTSEGGLYLTMRRFYGSTLQEVINESVKMGKAHPFLEGLPRKLEIITRICEAVAYAHSKGFIHQDIKPGNILLGDYGEVILADWGTARKKEDNDGKRKLIGTPAYMSPEQANKKGADERSDVYCIGTTMFHMLTLRHPTWSDEVEEFWEKKHKGIIDPLSDKEKHLLDPALEKVILKSLAYDPADRFQSVQEFINAIRQYEEDLECTNICRRANEDLRSGIDKGEYSYFLRSIMGYEHALEIHNDHEPAIKGLATAKNSYAACALTHGDLDLADEFVMDDNTELKAQIAAERLKRAKLKNKARLLIWSGAAAILIILSFGGYLLYDYYLHFGRWEIVEKVDFTGGTFDTEKLMFGDWDGEWDIPAEALQEDGFHVTGYGRQLIWFRNVKVHGDVRIELEVTWPEHPDGIEIMINSRREIPRHYGHVMPGYSCQFAGFDGRMNIISRNTEIQRPSLTNGVTSEYEAGRKYKLAFERVGDKVSLYIDNELIYSMTDILPLRGKGMNGVGFRAWIQKAVFHKATVRYLSLPQKASPLIQGEGLASYGNFEGALDTFMGIAQDTQNKKLKEQALARAYACALRIKNNTEDMQTAIRNQMEKNFPDSPYRTLILEMDAISTWEKGDYDTALAKLPEIFSYNPHTRVMLNILEISPLGIPPEKNQALLPWIARTTNLAILDLKERGLTDISALADLTLSSLRLSDNNLTSIESLQNIPLVALDISDNHIKSLEPLRNMPLKDLKCRSNNIHDLSPLAHMTSLERLDCNGNYIKDISPLKNLNLKSFISDRNDIADLSPLKDLPLKNLELDENRFTDITPLKDITTLKRLLLSRNRITSIPKFNFPKIRELKMDKCGIRDISPLSGLPLKRLALGSNEITDISPLKGMGLTHLELENNNISDISALEGMPLREFKIKGNNITDIQVLTNMSDLAELVINRNRISDLTPLQGCLKLKRVELVHNNITDLTPLENLSLKRVWASHNPFSSLGRFAENPPYDFTFYSPEIPRDEIVRITSTWEQNETNTFMIYRNTIEYLLDTKQYKKLKGLSVKAAWGNRYLYIPIPRTTAQSYEIAEKAGGHMASITTEEEFNFASSLIQEVNLNLIYLRVLNLGLKDHETWHSGEKVLFRPTIREKNFEKPGGRWTWIYRAEPGGGSWARFFDLDTPDQFIIEWNGQKTEDRSQKTESSK